MSSQELDDFEMALEVCRELDIETMVLLQPVNGRLYDRTRYGFDARQRYYRMVRDACGRAGAKVAVDTTEVKNIWKASGAKPGMVLYEVYTTVYITPRDGLAEQLKKK